MQILIPSAILALTLCGLSPATLAQGRRIGFEEEFALAPDRAATLERLIPGTEDDYYYRCLHAQNSADFGEVEPLLKSWIERHGHGARVQEIENRQVLLTYDADPDGAFEFLRRRLNLRFDHQREARDAESKLPTALDEGLISSAAWMQRALRSHPRTLAGFEDSGFELLQGRQLSNERLMKLLMRLQEPDYPDLPALIVRNLEDKQSLGFGSLTIHGRLLLEQLEECVRLQPQLLNEKKFVDIYLPRLRPDSDKSWQRDTRERAAYLDRLQAFAERLTPAHNSLKAHVLYHRLVLDLEIGQPDRTRFMAYMRLPRNSGHVEPEFLRYGRRTKAVVDLSRRFNTRLGRIESDDALVRLYLDHFFVTDSSYEPYAKYLRAEYLKGVFAETKILAGVGDMERWYSMLEPSAYEALKQRVEIEFTPGRRGDYGGDEAVSIAVRLKNVPQLIVKIYEVNALNYYLSQGAEVGAAINIDGLIAGEETIHEYATSPLRRVEHVFDFPSLAKPGVYVVEFIGGGLSSRAMIRKGKLQHVERVTAAGHLIQVLDENGQLLKSSSIHLGGREFVSDEAGAIRIPYSNDPGRNTIILHSGEQASLANFTHRAESTQLLTGIFVEREQLLAGGQARILVRPTLTINGKPASLGLLENVLLNISAVDRRGIRTSLDVRDFELHHGQESVHEIYIPADLARLEVQLHASIESTTSAEPVQLAGPRRNFDVNAIDATDGIACPLLGRTDAGYMLDYLGKNGEAKPGRALQLTLTHRDFKDATVVTLATDERGRIQLGELPGITHLSVHGGSQDYGSWDLHKADRTWPRRLHAVVGETLRVPYQGRGESLSRSGASLFELRAGALTRDRFENMLLKDAFIELSGLPAGDYQLRLKDAGRMIPVSITAGAVRGSWALGRDRLLERAAERPLHIASMGVDGDELVIQLAYDGPDARVHLFATRYMPTFNVFSRLRGASARSPQMQWVAHAQSSYHSGREIGDEFRYILDRRYAQKFAGNMLRRPGLLLNPWALAETATSMGPEGSSMNDIQGIGGGGGGAHASLGAGRSRSWGPNPGLFANLDFLPQGSRMLANLKADEEGRVRIPLADLGPGQHVHALAVELGSTVYESLALPEQPLVPTDKRLAESLDASQHLVEQRRIEFLGAGQSTVIEDVSTAEVESYETLGEIFQLFLTQSGSEELRSFSFLLGWPKLEAAEKRELYSRHACHEMHFFLHQKDRAFFDEVVRPYLANKAHKTFLDDWLLSEAGGSELRSYLDPWAFARLNIVERILLARRLADGAPDVARHLRELFELSPPTSVHAGLLFETALSGKGLSTVERGITRDSRALSALGYLTEPAAAPEVAAGEDRNAAKKLSKATERYARLGEESNGDFDLNDSLRGYDDKLVERELLEADGIMRQQQRALYRAPDLTRTYAEHNYWKLPIEQQLGGLIAIGPFWIDYALAKPGAPFVSTHFNAAIGSFAEMLFALAVLDLPFEAEPQQRKLQGERLELQASSPLLLIRKELRAAQAADERSDLIIAQHFFRKDDRYRYEGSERSEVFISAEFLIDVAYGCRIVVTNPTPKPRNLELLLQIPSGALPLANGFRTRGIPVQLAAYATTSLEYSFYFPQPGSFAHYPCQVGSDGKIAGYAEAFVFNVLAEPSTVDESSWEYLSQEGTSSQVLAYLERANLLRVDLSKIAWRLRDAEFFDELITALGARQRYDHLMWSYSLLHRDTARARAYLRHANAFLGSCGPYLDSPLLSIDPVERHTYQHLEYDPLFNPRAHRVGAQREILNRDFAAQYLRLLHILAYRPQLDDGDWMSITYYLLLQDRVGEALASFAKVQPANLPTRLQYDYMRAYLDFFSADHATARGIAESYRDHPVERWRNLFAEVLAQLDEAAGLHSGGDTEGHGALAEQTTLAASEPLLSLAVEAGRVSIEHANLQSCVVSYYEMDIEFLFSTSPFALLGSQGSTGSFAHIRPNLIDPVALPGDHNTISFDLPAAYRSSNLLIEASAGALRESRAYYANSLAVQMMENMGQLQVAHAETHQPLPKVYVKVYARLPGGRVRFHKDGYTDLRGRFDYASLSGEGNRNAERFAILVSSPTDGAIVREVAPPQR